MKDVPVPATLAWNGSYTVTAWVKNPQVSKEGECLASWCDRRAFNLANSYNALFYNSGNYGAAAHLDPHFDMRYRKVPAENKWHHIVLTFDGVLEKIYVDGVLDNAQSMTLASAIDKARIIIGASDARENYSGFMASLHMYDYALDAKEITEIMLQTKPETTKGPSQTGAEKTERKACHRMPFHPLCIIFLEFECKIERFYMIIWLWL